MAKTHRVIGVTSTNQFDLTQPPLLREEGFERAVRFRWTKARFFNKLKQSRRLATRCDKLGATFLAFLQLAAVRISLRLIESTS